MAETWDQARIQRLIDDQVQESLNLEYKAAGALDRTDKKREEISKDVSAMANAEGGNVIYGVAEYRDPNKRHLPEKIDPIDQTQYSREWLDEIMSRNIHPPIDGLVIHPIPIQTAPNHVVYVVEVPQSTTAHQALDKKYYKRRNFKNDPMDDYEIRDIMGRQKHPKIELDFTIEVSTGYDQSVFRSEPRKICSLKIIARNVSSVYAQYVNAFIRIPAAMLTEFGRIGRDIFEEDGQDYCEHYEDNTIRDVVGYEGLAPKYGPSRYDPILPGLFHTWDIEINCQLPKGWDDLVIKWVVHADNAQRHVGEVAVKDIVIVDRRDPTETVEM